MPIQHDTNDHTHACPVCGQVHEIATLGDLDIWHRRDMRDALTRRDMSAVFHLLRQSGVSQRKIAIRTEQTQSEISEIINGARRVNSYDLLLRIAKGLGIPRNWLGLGYGTDNGEPPPL